MTAKMPAAAPRTKAERLVEPGSAFVELNNLHAATRIPRRRERYDVVVIGGGQAGLSVGYHLARHGLRFVILDASARIGDSWRNRWDSLRLFTSARFDGLEGMPFPAPPHSFPTKDEMAAYLEAYAARFALPVRSGVRVDRLTREDDCYVVTAGGEQIEADQVVVAMSNYQRPSVPAFAAGFDPGIVQLHSSEYRNSSQLRDGGVLVVGAGNSGAEIARELAGTHRVWLSGRNTGQIPFRIDGFWGRRILVRLVLRVVFHRVLTVRTPIGRRVRPKVLRGGGALIRVKHEQLEAMGVRHAPRTVGVRDGLPQLEDGRVLDVANVIWCTGFSPGLSWVDLPVIGADGEPIHDRGVAGNEPGLYFVGLHFLYAMSSVMIHGVGRDAERVVETLVSRARTRHALEHTPSPAAREASGSRQYSV
ncbi:MAG: flavin-containing monooxygenase [Betaproteobacteria bacterium]